MLKHNCRIPSLVQHAVPPWTDETPQGLNKVKTSNRHVERQEDGKDV